MRKTLLQLLLVVFTLSAVPLGAHINGSGTELDPYQITTVEQLQDMRENLDAHYILMNDIDASVTSTWNVGDHDGDGGTPNEAMGFEPIGDNVIGDGSDNFRGTLDGAGFAIRNLTINRPGRHQVGLIGYGNAATVQSLHLESASVTGSDEVGGFVGRGVSGSVVEHCTLDGAISSWHHCGGIMGFNKESRVSHCGTSGTVTASAHQAGGIVGLNHGGTIEYCYSHAAVDGDINVGGIVGSLSKGDSEVRSKVSYCYATGAVTGYTRVAGGIAGNSYNSSIEYCYTTSHVSNSADVKVGGAVGGNGGTSTITGTFWNSETSGTAEGIGFDANGQTTISSTTTAMKDAATYIAEGWVFNSPTWVTEPNSYPRLEIDFPFRGAGTAANPYQIGTVEQLQAMQNDLAAHYILMNDIDASETANWNVGDHDGDDQTPYEPMGFEPIGISSSPFTGKLDGNGKIITGLTIHRTSRNNVGLIGCAEKAIIERIGVEGTIRGNSNVAGIIGNNLLSTVKNSFVSGSISGNWYVGGVMGKTNNSSIKDCYSSASVYGGSSIGGIAGDNNLSTVNTTYSTGDVTGYGTHIGGIVGYNVNSKVYNSFCDTSTCSVSMISGGNGRSTDDLMKKATYEWYYFDDFWVIDEGEDYPRLAWSVRKLSYSSSNGTVDDTLQYVFNGADGLPVSVTPNAGYIFEKWDDNSTDNPRQDLNVTADIAVTAMFRWDGEVTVRDSVVSAVITGTPVVTTELVGTSGKEDTVITTTVIDTAVDTTWSINDTLLEDGSTASSEPVVKEVKTTEKTPVVSTETKKYQQVITTEKRDSVVSGIVPGTTVVTKELIGEAGKEDTLIVTTVVDTAIDSTWSITDTLGDGVVFASSEAVFVSAEKTSLDAVVSTETKKYQQVISTEKRDSVVSGTLPGIPVVTTELIGETGKEDTLIVTTVVDTAIDSTWSITDTLGDGVVFASSEAEFVSAEKTSLDAVVTYETKEYLPNVTKVTRDSVVTTTIAGTPVVTTELVGETGTEDTVITTTVIDTVIDSTWQIIDTYSDGVKVSSSAAMLVKTESRMEEPVITSETKEYKPSVTTTVIDSVVQCIVSDTLVDTTFTGEVDKEDTVITTTVIDTLTDSIWKVTTTLTDGVVTDSKTEFVKDSTYTETVSVESATLEYQEQVAVVEKEMSVHKGKFSFAPNPVPASSSSIRLRIPDAVSNGCDVTILDPLGNVVDNQTVNREYRWNLTNRVGVLVGSGTYVALISWIDDSGRKQLIKKTLGIQR